MVDARISKRGFTLIELMVTVAVLAIMAAIAIPNFQTFLMNSRMASQANDVITAFNLARSEAVKRAANVTVCASSNSTSTNPSCTGSWQQGWIVRDAGGTPIRVQAALSGASTLSGGASTITFTASGRTTSAATTLTLCPPSPAVVQGRAIQIEPTGRSRFAPVACP